MGNQQLNALSEPPTLNNTVCPRAPPGQDIYGQPIDFDPDFYKFFNAFDMYYLYLQSEFNSRLRQGNSSSLNSLNSFSNSSNHLPSSNDSQTSFEGSSNELTWLGSLQQSTLASSNQSLNLNIFLGGDSEAEKTEIDLLYRRPEFLASVADFIQHIGPDSSDDPDGDPKRLEQAIMLRKFLTLVAYSAIILISLFGNLLVLFIILSRSRLRVQTTNKLIANLTFSDCMLTLLTIPLTIGKCFFFYFERGIFEGDDVILKWKKKKNKTAAAFD